MSKKLSLCIALTLVCIFFSVLYSQEDQTALPPQYGVVQEPGGVATTSVMLPHMSGDSVSTAQTSPVQAFVADFDGDGKGDFCLPQVADESGEDGESLIGIGGFVLVGFGDGAGGIDEEKGVRGFLQIAEDSHPGYIAWGDLNEDGCADIVTVHSSGDTNDSVSAPIQVVAWFGGKDATFRRVSILELEGAVYAIRVLDAGVDGHQDILVLAATEETVLEVALWPGNGNGGFDPPIRSVPDFPLMASNPNIRIGDVNGDGIQDIVLAALHGGKDVPGFRMIVALGTGHGEYSFRLGKRLDFWPRYLGLEDINGDDIDDACVVHWVGALADDESGKLILDPYESTEISVLLGTPAGELRPLETYDVRLTSRYVHLTDLDSDGHADAVLVDGRGIALVMKGTPEGTLSPPQAFSSANGSHSVCWSSGIGDVTGNGDSDLFCQLLEQELVVRFGDGKGGFGSDVLAPPISTDLGFYATRLSGPADFDQDGRLDLVFLDGEGVGIAYGDGAGGFAEITLLVRGPGWRSAGVGDFDGNGLCDVLIGQEYGQQAEGLRLYLNRGDREFLQPTPPGDSIATPIALDVDHQNDIMQLLAGDFDEDGLDDVVVCGSSDSYLLHGSSDGLLLRGVSLSPSSEEMTASNSPSGGGRLFTPHIVDTNSDGHLDVVAIKSRFPSNCLLIWFGDGTGHFRKSSEYPYNIIYGWPADANKDGYPDLIARHKDQEIHILYGSETGTFRADALAAEPWMGVAARPVGDLNGDGNVDFAEAWGVVLWVYLGDGQGGRGPRFQFAPHAWGEFSYNIDSLPGDFDGDGSLDIALPSKFQVTILLNRFSEQEDGG